MLWVKLIEDFKDEVRNARRIGSRRLVFDVASASLIFSLTCIQPNIVKLVLSDFAASLLHLSLHLSSRHGCIHI
jgi:hypothetical protein